MLAPWKKIYEQPRQHIKKQRHYFANKGPSSQSCGFSSGHVWMWELDHKEDECLRIDAFELWCWRRLLSVPWTARRSNQSILKKISPEILIGRTEAETPILWPPDAKNWCWERLKVGGEGDNRGWDGWMASVTRWTCVWASSRSWWWTGKLGMLQSMGSQRVGHDWATELNWVPPREMKGRT